LTLDCSDLTGPIRSLSGIERLTNLEHLDISGIAGFAISPDSFALLSQLVRLRSFTAVGSGLRYVTVLSGLPLLANARLDGPSGPRLQRRGRARVERRCRER
jgi:hypothetical protein